MRPIATLLAALFLAAPSAQAADLLCVKNSFGHQGIKSICQLSRSDDVGSVAGFLLFNANGTKSYLRVIRTGRPVSVAPFVESTRYRVVASNDRLGTLGPESSTMVIESDVENPGNFSVKGKTPGGREVDSHGAIRVESDALSDMYNFVPEDWEPELFLPDVSWID